MCAQQLEVAIQAHCVVLMRISHARSETMPRKQPQPSAMLSIVATTASPVLHGPRPTLVQQPGTPGHQMLGTLLLRHARPAMPGRHARANGQGAARRGPPWSSGLQGSNGAQTPIVSVAAAATPPAAEVAAQGARARTPGSDEAASRAWPGFARACS